MSAGESMRVAVIGAGPIGIEAAWAATRAGHEVVVLEAGEVSDALRQWGALRLFTPWRMNTTAAGRALLGDPSLAGEDCPTAEALVTRYLLPLAAHLDVRTHQRVRGVSRGVLGKSAQIGSPERMGDPFRLLVTTADGESVLTAEVVVDCTGTASDPAPAGMGGLEAPGEAAARAAGKLRHGPVPVADLAGARVALVGDGASAATVLRTLRAQGGTEVWWLTPSAEAPGFASPPDDPLPERRALFVSAREALADPSVRHLPGRYIVRLQTADDVTLHLDDGQTVGVDAVVACTGFRPDGRLHRELQVHTCYASEGPMKLAAALLGGSGDCLAPQVSGPDLLRSPEPGFFLLGSKSYGRRSDFLLATGHRQVDELITLIGAA